MTENVREMQLRCKPVLFGPFLVGMRDAPIMLRSHRAIAHLTGFQGTDRLTIVADPDWKCVGHTPFAMSLGMIRSVPPHREQIKFATVHRLYIPRHLAQTHEISEFRRPQISL